MTSPGSRPDRIGRLLAGLARQLELPFLGALVERGTPTDPVVRGQPKSDDPRGPATRPPTGPTRPSSPPKVEPVRRSIRLHDGAVDYALRRARRKTIGFSIGPAGLTVAAPRWVGIRQIEDALRGRADWIVAKLADAERHRASIPRVRWEDGGTLPYLGAPITLRIVPRPAGGTRGRAPIFDVAARTLTLFPPAEAPPAVVRDLATGWLRSEARAVFGARLAVYEARLGRRHRVLRLSSARTRWGSCSADGRILLNWRLIHFPLAAVDYVVAHELSHLKEMNHGPRFWATVATILPGYEATRAQMKNPPPELLPTL